MNTKSKLILGSDGHASAQRLSHLLASTYMLYLKTQNFHWNVEGPHFAPLHDFFEDQYRDLAKAIDEIAERIRTLGYYAPGTMAEFLSLSLIAENPHHLSDQEMLSTLWADHRKIIDFIRESVEILEAGQDHGTVDFMVQRMQDHEKKAWMILSQSPQGSSAI